MIDKRFQFSFIIVLMVALGFVLYFILKPFLAPIFLAIVFSVVLQGVYKKFLFYSKNSESLSALATILISVVCAIIPVMFLSIQLFGEASSLYSSNVNSGDSNQILKTLSSFGSKIDKLIPGSASVVGDISTDLDIYIKKFIAFMSSNFGVIFSQVSRLFIDLFVFLIALYYFLRDGHKLKKEIISISPLDDKDDEFIFSRLETAVNSVIKGRLLIAIVQGVLTMAGLYMFNVPNGVLWGSFAIISALIPGVGTMIVTLPAIIYLIVTGDNTNAILLAIWGILFVGLIDNLLGPKFMGKGLDLHPFIVLLSVLGGVLFFGPIGIFLGPIVASLFISVLSIYSYLILKNQKS